jgi:hypothetical protein
VVEFETVGGSADPPLGGPVRVPANRTSDMLVGCFVTRSLMLST